MTLRPFRERHALRTRRAAPRRRGGALWSLTAVVLLVVGVAFAYGRLSSRWGLDAARMAPPESAAVLIDRVVDVIDGDTVRTARYGRVRYIGVDTPEMDAHDPDVRRMAQQAREANERLVAGREVRLVLDVQSHDRYGRLLAYVWVDDLFVNAWLVQEGYARVLTVPPNVRYAERFLELERQARRDRRGLWALPQR